MLRGRHGRMADLLVHNVLLCRPCIFPLVRSFAHEIREITRSLLFHAAKCLLFHIFLFSRRYIFLKNR